MVGRKTWTSIAAVLGLATLGATALPRDAEAHWRREWGYRYVEPPVVVVAPPAYYYAPPVYYAPPPVRYWEPHREHRHWEHGYRD